MTHTATHMIPVELAPTHRLRTRLLWTAAWLVAALVALLPLVHHYGGQHALNEGYTLGTSSMCVGFETHGDVGFFVGCED